MQYSDNRYLPTRMLSVSDALPSTSCIYASGAVFRFFHRFCASLTKPGITPYPPMPVSDIGRKGRRVDKVIPLLLRRRDSRCWRTFGAETTRTWLHTSMP